MQDMLCSSISYMERMCIHVYYLYVCLSDEPWPMCQKFVECLQALDFKGSTVNTSEPGLIATGQQKCRAMQPHQVGTPMPSRRLQKQREPVVTIRQENISPIRHTSIGRTSYVASRTIMIIQCLHDSGKGPSGCSKAFWVRKKQFRQVGCIPITVVT